MKNASVRQPPSPSRCPLLCHPDRSEAEGRDLRFAPPAADVAWRRHPFLVIPRAPACRGTCASPFLPGFSTERSRGICGSADISWKMASLTSYRVEARRAVTRRQPSPEGLGHRRAEAERRRRGTLPTLLPNLISACTVGAQPYPMKSTQQNRPIR